MKSKYILIAAFTTMLMACSKESESMNDSVPVNNDHSAVATQLPVSFGAYVNRATTRAGATGVLTINGTGNGQVSLQEEGFGVFTYYTDDKPYSPNYQPNFMYNTRVSGVNWTYEPIRYWPNENSENDVNEGLDRLSFFAYAPHVSVNQITGFVANNPESGIVAMNRNGAIGDPMIYYRVDYDPANQVDFCWGTPHVDMTKPAVGQPVEFEFNHALAALNVQIDAIIDEVSPGNNNIEDETKIYVRSVTFEGFAEQGAFNLNTTTDTFIWYDITGTDYIEGDKVVIHDGRINGNEGSSEAINELPKGLNRVIVQSARYGDSDLPSGVTKDAVNLFDNTAIDAPIYVIPTGQPLKLTIVYDVETQVDKLPGYLSDGVTHGSSIENKITKTITLNAGENLRLEAGKKYTVKLHLGMQSLKFDASISDWDAGSSANADMPINSSTTPDPTPTPTVGYYRGYDISKGILVRSIDGSNVTYSLTDGSNPFELYDYYGKSESIDKYYHDWFTLRTELGANGDDIEANSEKLPAYPGGGRWTMPSGSYLFDDDIDDYVYSGEWEAILEGAPLQQIVVGNTTIGTNEYCKAWALVTVTYNNTDYHGVLILRDGTTIPEGLLDESTLGEDYLSGYDDNELDMEEFNELVTVHGCLFISCSGYYVNNATTTKWDYLPDSWADDHGQYWSGIYDIDSNSPYYFVVNVDYGTGDGYNGDNDYGEYRPVHLVKKMVP
ncbi:MAG: fimbrillin family protein [Bacteroidaceae bacterium]|nr:fimbrillin family protein [Bacteroidaceae bacterium]